MILLMPLIRDLCLLLAGVAIGWWLAKDHYEL